MRFGSQGCTVSDWVIDDPEVVTFLRELPEERRAEALQMAVRIGIHALRQTSTVVNVDYIERELTRTSQEVSHGFEVAFSEVQKQLARIFDESDGVLSRELAKYLSEQGSLGQLFDERQKGSVLSKLMELLDRQFGPNGSVLMGLFDLNRDGSPLRALKRDVETRLEEHRDATGRLIRNVGDQLTALNERMAAQGELFARQLEASKTIKGLYDRSAAKGVDYEGTVVSFLGRIASVFGDVVDEMTTEAGIGRKKVGDFLVHLNPEDTDGAEVSFVVEAKDSKLTQPAILKELEAAMQNRGAKAGLMVFGSLGHVPAQVGALRDFPGLRYVCLLDRENADDTYLQGAYRFIRMQLLHNVRSAPVTVDLPALVDLIRAARVRVDLIAKVKHQLNSSKSGLDDAAKLLDQMRNELIEDFRKMDGFVKREPGGEEGTVA